MSQHVTIINTCEGDSDLHSKKKKKQQNLMVMSNSIVDSMWLHLLMDVVFYYKYYNNLE